MHNIIDIDNLYYTYPRSSLAALQGVSLTIPKGSLFGLLGPNGAGKTTLLSLLTGALRAKQQKVTIHALTLSENQQAIKKICAYVPQDFAFYLNLSVQENLQFFIGILDLPKADHKQRIEQCIEFCQLQSYTKQYAANLSGGLKRRLNIAIGLLSDPEILYLDEPTVGIDPQSRAFILDKIKELNHQGKTIIYTSHYMDEIEKICSHIAIIDHGKVLLQNTLAELRNSMQTELRLQCSRSLSSSETELFHHQFGATVNDTLIHCTRQNIAQKLADIFLALDKFNIAVIDASYHQCDLEALFLQLTSKDLRD